jgi:hypothetical protein
VNEDGSGVLTVDKQYIELLGPGGSQDAGTYMRKGGATTRHEFYTFQANSGIYIPSLTDVDQLYCSHFKTNLTGSNTEYMCYMAASQFRIILPLNNSLNISTEAEMNAWLAEQKTAGTPVCYAVQLVNATTYELSAEQITTLLGVNNIWCDTGDTSVEYRADTKLYIDNKFAELQALILENISNS